MNATAAIVMHYGGNDWSQAQIQAMQTVRQHGIKVIAVTDAGFKAEKQVSDIEPCWQKPNIIVGILWTRRPRRSPSRPLPTRA
jgi:ribose transport system substrate-binding protein